MRRLVLSAAILGLAIVSTPVMASGGGGGGGGFGGGFNNTAASGSRVSPEDRLSNRGKSQVKKRITCKNCEYHNQLNQQTASKVAQAVRAGDFELNKKNREAVLFYLRERYGV